MITLDHFDRKILDALQKDGRLTSQQLAETTALSASQCARRRQRLEQLGVIKGYTARVSKRRVGLAISAFIEVTLNNRDRSEIDSFSRLVETNPSILDAYKLTGPTDCLLRVTVSNLDEMNYLISEVLVPHTAVASVQSHVVLEWLKEDGVLPI